jgi:hypothetical protein
MTKIMKTVMAAIAALALTTGSMAISSQAFAGGKHGGGHGHHGGHGHGGHGHHGHGHHGHHGHHHHWHGGHHFYAHNSCWKWTPRGPINICYRYY